MKRLLILCIVIALGFGVTGATCLQNVQTQVCSPPANVIAVAKAVAPIIQMAIIMAVPGSAAYLAAIDAAGIVDYVQSGLCISTTQLNNLIAFLKSDVFNAAEVKMMAKRGPAKAELINIQPLLDWR